MNDIVASSERFANQTIRSAFREWLSTKYPNLNTSTLASISSRAFYLHNNDRGITLEEALTLTDGIQQAHDSLMRHYESNPHSKTTPNIATHYFISSLKLLREFLETNYPELLDLGFVTYPKKTHEVLYSLPAHTSIIPAEIVSSIEKNYTSGFRFETTYINLLSASCGVEIDKPLQNSLRKMMFNRSDEVYFLPDTVADSATRKDIVQFASDLLEEFGCFEISEFFKLYENGINRKCIRTQTDFESFFEQFGPNGVRLVAVPQIGNRIVRYSSGSAWDALKRVAHMIVAMISDEHHGSCSLHDLHSHFCAFSEDLIEKIIKNCAKDELIRSNINDTIYYQTYDALSLPDDFSDRLAQVLESLSDINIAPTLDILHAAISLEIGVNLMAEYNLPDKDAFKRLITARYVALPERAWRNNIFEEK